MWSRKFQACLRKFCVHAKVGPTKQPLIRPQRNSQACSTRTSRPMRPGRARKCEPPDQPPRTESKKTSRRRNRTPEMSHSSTSTLSAGEALLRLKAGNDRFVAGTAKFPTVYKEVLAELAKGQHPYAPSRSWSYS